MSFKLQCKKCGNYLQGQICCDYGTKGTGIDNKGAYDCLMIPGALTSKSGVQAGESFCGGMVGLFKTNSATSGKTTTLCCKF